MFAGCVSINVEWYIPDGWVEGEGIKVNLDVCDCCNFESMQLVGRRLDNPYFYTDPPSIEEASLATTEGLARIDMLGGDPIYLNDSGDPGIPNTINMQWVSETGLISPGSDEDWYMGPGVEIPTTNLRRVYRLELCLLAKCDNVWIGSRVWRIMFLNKLSGTQYPNSTYTHPAWNYSETDPP